MTTNVSNGSRHRAQLPRPATRLEHGKGRVVRVLVLVAMLAVTLVLGYGYPLLSKGAEWLDVQWRYPYVLWLLLLVPLVLWRVTFGEDRRVPRLRMGITSAFAKGPRGWRSRLRDLPGVFRAVAMSLLIVALAQPVSLVRPETTKESGIDIMVVLDLSGSMRAVLDGAVSDVPKRAAQRGVRPTRLDVAKAVIQDFISRRKSDRIGVIVFGQSAYVLSPPTLDYQLLSTLVGGMSLNVISGTATAIGEAVGVAVARLRRSDARSKAVVLLTDGDSNAGNISPEYAAHLATVVGARVYTIQIGDGDVVDVQDGFDLFGNPRYVQVRFPVNPELLQTMAKTTGGQSYVATDAKALQKSMHDVLDALEKTSFEASKAVYADWFSLLLLPGVILLALDALGRAWILRRFP